MALIEVGDQSPEAVKAYVRAAIREMPQATQIAIAAQLLGMVEGRKGSSESERMRLLYSHGLLAHFPWGIRGRQGDRAVSGPIAGGGKLQLSQVRPGGLFSQRQAAPAFTGNCFLSDGRFTTGVGLRDEQEAAAYVMLQRAYQYRVLICDHESLAVLEMAEGQVYYAASGLREALAVVLFGRASPWHEWNERQ